MGGLPSQGRDPGQSGGFAHVRRNPEGAGGHGAQPVFPRAAAFWVLSSAPSRGARCLHHRRVRGPPAPQGHGHAPLGSSWAPLQLVPAPGVPAAARPSQMFLLDTQSPSHLPPLPASGRASAALGSSFRAHRGQPCHPGGRWHVPPQPSSSHSGISSSSSALQRGPPPCSPARGGQRPQMTAGGRPRLPCAQRRRGCCGATSATGPPGAGSRPGPACGAHDLAAGR